jgi:hypothetical protein
VADTCNPATQGGRDQEDHSLKPPQANSSARPYLKKPSTNIGLVEWPKVKGLSSSPSTTKKRAKEFLQRRSNKYSRNNYFQT